MARYVDGFVIAIPRKNLKAYTRMAREGKRLWMKYGALDYKECMGDDMQPKGVTFTFPKMMRLKKGKVAFSSFIVYKSRTPQSGECEGNEGFCHGQRARRNAVRHETHGDGRLHGGGGQVNLCWICYTLPMDKQQQEQLPEDIIEVALVGEVDPPTMSALLSSVFARASALWDKGMHAKILCDTSKLKSFIVPMKSMIAQGLKDLEVSKVEILTF